jgi:hypothetical protein
VYQERCKEENLHENQHAVPRDLLCAREKEKREKKAGQRNLDEMFQKAEKPKEFSRDNVLKAVAEFAVCDDQVCGFKLAMTTKVSDHTWHCRASAWQTRPFLETVSLRCIQPLPMQIYHPLMMW